MLLEVNHISRRDRRTQEQLLEGISLAVTGGERVALRGRSGSGKSLLLRAIALLDPLDQGTVTWRGENVSGTAVPEFRSRVVYLPQQALVAEDTVEEALQRPFLYRSNRIKAFDAAQTLERLKQLGRSHSFLEKQTSDLSGGEKQITALLRALAIGPTVLLLDEATSALDIETTLAAEGLIDSWQRGKIDERACVWVSHDTAQSERVAQRTLHIEAGRLQGETS
jgi:putative ABC transport system ATP-binding protein